MEKRILDTQVLIAHWRRRYVHPRAKQTIKDARKWAKELIEIHDTNAIVTPVYIEMLVGTVDRHQRRLTLEFLLQFRCIDQMEIKREVWRSAIHLAGQIPESAKPRDFADCLIRAIARQLGYEVKTANLNFPD